MKRWRFEVVMVVMAAVGLMGLAAKKPRTNERQAARAEATAAEQGVPRVKKWVERGKNDPVFEVQERTYDTPLGAFVVTIKCRIGIGCDLFTVRTPQGTEIRGNKIDSSDYFAGLVSSGTDETDGRVFLGTLHGIYEYVRTAEGEELKTMCGGPPEPGLDRQGRYRGVVGGYFVGFSASLSGEEFLGLCGFEEADDPETGAVTRRWRWHAFTPAEGDKVMQITSATADTENRRLVLEAVKVSKKPGVIKVGKQDEAIQIVYDLNTKTFTQGERVAQRARR